METYYPCTWLSFVNQKNEKIRNWSLLMKIISTVPKLLFFKTTDLHTICIPILLICWQLKHHQLRIRSKIFISLEIILNAFNVILLSPQEEQVRSSSWRNRCTHLAVHSSKRLKPLSVTISVCLCNT